ncbi:hypothetical protein BDK51DRAFT_37114 [Blyttiomyces helicus]|uniref:Uncharacterized protein n=1 Tax=Blyttiomyces helicus TaxID=388810 RepID=A0A4P9VYP8_9FUNG|nr:hypothetical protein BDK51DRAFT_37114 [Blyttiomyces helicus]|eukprot:RKO83438.1 hypothetical protein BDK51DRAFT_37114 [Blyttiomyces helicus]
MQGSLALTNEQCQATRGDEMDQANDHMHKSFRSRFPDSSQLQAFDVSADFQLLKFCVDRVWDNNHVKASPYNDILMGKSQSNAFLVDADHALLRSRGSKEEILFISESTTTYVMEPALRRPSESFVAFYNSDRATVCAGKKAVEALDELDGYLTKQQIKYGALTTYEHTWFVKREPDGSFAVSPPVMACAYPSPASVTLKTALGYIWSLAEVDHELPVANIQPSGISATTRPSSDAEFLQGATYSPTSLTSLQIRQNVSREPQPSMADPLVMSSSDSEHGVPPDLLRQLPESAVFFDPSTSYLGSGAMGTVYFSDYFGFPQH